jgi:X-X-X-Leu-X-X-Gly heptad repeat protein
MRDLPDLHLAVLDDASIDQLHADIAALTEVIDVLTKQGRRDYAADAAVTLDDGVAQLRSGAARCLQIRYHYDDAQWWDTLVAVPGGYRLVRVRHDFQHTAMS